MNKLAGRNTLTTVGADPEIFIQKDGKIVGAEKVIPKEGLRAKDRIGYGGNIIIDGVQAEINPNPSHCRALFGRNIQACLNTLSRNLKEKGFDLSKSGTVTVDKKELESLEKENQRLGCGPSNNFYDASASVKVNQKNKYIRSAGGHIHLQLGKSHGEKKPVPEILVPVLDLFVGNTCVLLDRDPLQATRRKMYGRAGEYRLPKHGLEYRTPSNFWLRSFPLMGLVTNLCRMAVRVGHGSVQNIYNNFQYTYTKEEPEKEAMEWLDAHVDKAKVQEAINENDFDLAYANWQLFREFIEIFIKNEPRADASDGMYPLWPNMLDQFEFFAVKGIDYWWPNTDIVHQWNTFNDGHGNNWEAWFDRTVIPEFRINKEDK